MITLQFWLCATLFLLIILGAGVRIWDAGLACPDWPLCHGHWIPPFDLQVFLEWFHRLIAMIVGLMALAVGLSIWIQKKYSKSLKTLIGISFLLFLVQAFLGRQTVLELLHASTVSAHLVGGYLLFSVNVLIYFILRGVPGWKIQTNSLFLGLCLVVVFIQALLGARVSSHYAGLACGAEFPRCLGVWWPSISEAQIHMIHRWGAFVVGAFLFGGLYYVRKSKHLSAVRKVYSWSFAVYALQILIALGMIFLALHPALRLLHSAASLSLYTLLLWGTLYVSIRR